MRKRHLLEMSQSESTNSNNRRSPAREVKRARTMSSSSEADAEPDAGRRGLWKRCCSWFSRKKVSSSNLLNIFPSWTLNNGNNNVDQENPTQLNDTEDFPANTKFARHIRKGFALIINNHEFVDQTVTKREGTVIDEKSFKKVIQDFGFSVRKLRDGKVDEIFKTVEQAATMDHSEHECILVLVSTHGFAGGILHASDKQYNVHDVWLPFLNNKNLNHLPKIFIFQACRGISSDLGQKLGPLEDTRLGAATSRNDAVNGNSSIHSSTSSISEIFDAEIDNSSSKKQVTLAPMQNELHPNYPNILMAYSTVEEYYSWRDPSKGTYYIQSLCSILEKGKDRDFVSLLTRVHRDVASKSPSRPGVTPYHDREILKQAPSLTSSLTYKIFLHKASI